MSWPELFYLQDKHLLPHSEVMKHLFLAARERSLTTYDYDYTYPYSYQQGTYYYKIPYWKPLSIKTYVDCGYLSYGPYRNNYMPPMVNYVGSNYVNGLECISKFSMPQETPTLSGLYTDNNWITSGNIGPIISPTMTSWRKFVPIISGFQVEMIDNNKRIWDHCYQIKLQQFETNDSRIKKSQFKGQYIACSLVVDLIGSAQEIGVLGQVIDPTIDWNGYGPGWRKNKKIIGTTNISIDIQSINKTYIEMISGDDRTGTGDWYTRTRKYVDFSYKYPLFWEIYPSWTSGLFHTSKLYNITNVKSDIDANHGAHIRYEIGGYMNFRTYSQYAISGTAFADPMREEDAGWLVENYHAPSQAQAGEKYGYYNNVYSGSVQFGEYKFDSMFSFDVNKSVSGQNRNYISYYAPQFAYLSAYYNHSSSQTPPSSVIDQVVDQVFDEVQGNFTPIKPFIKDPDWNEIFNSQNLNEQTYQNHLATLQNPYIYGLLQVDDYSQCYQYWDDPLSGQ